MTVIVCLTAVSDGSLLWVSPRGLRAILGFEPSEVLGTAGWALLTGLTGSERVQRDQAALAAGGTMSAGYDARHRAGHPVPLRVTGWRVDDDVSVGLAVRST